MKVIADVLGCPMVPLPDADAVAARGCAAEAMPWLGAWPEGQPSPQFFPSLIPGEKDDKTGVRVVMPDEAAVESYSRLYEVYRELYPALKGTGAYGLSSTGNSS